MAEWNLWPAQQELIRKLVDAVKAGYKPRFERFANSMFDGVTMGADGKPQLKIPCDSADLQALHDVGLVKILTFGSGEVQARAMRVVEENFGQSALQSLSPGPSQIINIHGGTVGAIQSGKTNQASVQQATTSEDAKDLAALAKTLRELAGTVEQRIAAEQIAKAADAAKQGDGVSMRGLLKTAGGWALGVGKEIGVKVATEMLSKHQ